MPKSHKPLNTQTQPLSLSPILQSTTLTKFITTCSSILLSLSLADPFDGIRQAHRVFDLLPRKDETFLCNSMIKAHVGIRQFFIYFSLYRDLRRDMGFMPDNFTFWSLAKSCALDKAIREGKQIHNYVIKIGFCLDIYASTSLLDMYAKAGKMGGARNLFDEMTRSQVSWIALIGGYARSGEMVNAKKLFDMMPEKDLAAFNMMVDAYVKFGDVLLARSLFDEMPEGNMVSWTSMISVYYNNDDVDTARSLFDTMPEKNLFSWNAMIGGYSRNKQPYEALKLFHEKQSSTSLEPDAVTVLSVLPAIADLGALDLTGWVHQFVYRKKLDKATNVRTTLLDKATNVCTTLLDKATNVATR